MDIFIINKTFSNKVSQIFVQKTPIRGVYEYIILRDIREKDHQTLFLENHEKLFTSDELKNHYRFLRYIHYNQLENFLIDLSLEALVELFEVMYQNKYRNNKNFTIEVKTWNEPEFIEEYKEPDICGGGDILYGDWWDKE